MFLSPRSFLYRLTLKFAWHGWTGAKYQLVEAISGEQIISGMAVLQGYP
jgi:hypothetical protein